MKTEERTRRLFRAVAEGLLLAAVALSACGPMPDESEKTTAASTAADGGTTNNSGTGGGWVPMDGVGGGRPLLLDGAAVTAAVVLRSDWA